MEIEKIRRKLNGIAEYALDEPAATKIKNRFECIPDEDIELIYTLAVECCSNEMNLTKWV